MTHCSNLKAGLSARKKHPAAGCLRGDPASYKVQSRHFLDSVDLRPCKNSFEFNAKLRTTYQGSGGEPQPAPNKMLFKIFYSSTRTSEGGPHPNFATRLKMPGIAQCFGLPAATPAWTAPAATPAAAAPAPWTGRPPANATAIAVVAARTIARPVAAATPATATPAATASPSRHRRIRRPSTLFQLNRQLRWPAQSARKPAKVELLARTRRASLQSR